MKCQSYDDELLDETDDLEEDYEEERYFPYKRPVFTEDECQPYRRVNAVRLKAACSFAVRNRSAEPVSSGKRRTLMRWGLSTRRGLGDLRY